MKRTYEDLNSADLSPEQKSVVEAVNAGMNVFFTGSAGTGKSYTLRRIITQMQNKYDTKTVHVTASTGIAATNIGGTTLHSYASIGLGNESVDVIMKKLNKYRSVADRWRATRVLIVDEISMLSTEFFIKLDTIAKRIRGNRSPFGGIQLILSGDFLQLPAIDKKGGLLFQCTTWKECVTRTIELKTVFRQRDARFIALLQDLRKGIVTDETDAFLRSRIGRKKDDAGQVKPTKLYSHRVDVDQENALQLAKLTGEPKQYTAQDSGPQKENAAKLFMAPTQLTLKLHAQVILISNLDPPNLVNGSRGVIIGFDVVTQDPIVQFNCGVTLCVGPHVWESKRGDEIVVRRHQIPLMLGWAMSIHKSQGMTLDLLETDISQCWDSGQAYVALSRATSIEGLHLLGYKRECIKADPAVLDYYASVSQ